MLTIKYPQIESYLKDLLNYFTTAELENIDKKGWSILHVLLSYKY